jgi:hypothetical protein
MSLYAALNFAHLLGVAVFLFAHGVSAGASLLLRHQVAASARQLLELSRRSTIVANPALLVIIITGVWMGFVGSWWGHGWIWVSIVVLVLVIASMFYVARPYYLARDAAKDSDQALIDSLGRTRPLLAAWIGGGGVVVLITLMVFKPF